MTLLQERHEVGGYHDWGGTLPDNRGNLAGEPPASSTDTRPAPFFEYPLIEEPLAETTRPKKHLLSKIGSAILGLLGRRPNEPEVAIEQEQTSQEPDQLPHEFDRHEFYETTYEEFSAHHTRLRDNEKRKRFIDWQCQKAKLARRALQSNLSNGNQDEVSTDTFPSEQAQQDWNEPETTELPIITSATDSADNPASFWFSEPQIRQTTPDFFDEPTVPLPKVSLDVQTKNLSNQPIINDYPEVIPNESASNTGEDQTPVSVALVAAYNYKLTGFRTVFPAIAALTQPELYSRTSMH
jgi:hypothetical protein